MKRWLQQPSHYPDLPLAPEAVGHGEVEAHPRRSPASGCRSGSSALPVQGLHPCRCWSCRTGPGGCSPRRRRNGAWESGQDPLLPDGEWCGGGCRPSWASIRLSMESVAGVNKLQQARGVVGGDIGMGQGRAQRPGMIRVWARSRLSGVMRRHSALRSRAGIPLEGGCHALRVIPTHSATR